MSPLRLAFMGTPIFAAEALASLIAAGHRIVQVYCQPPRPAGRGQKVLSSAVQALAAARGLPVRTPASLKDPAEADYFAGLGLDAAVVAAYGQILPKPFLAVPRLGCLNIHASLLPRWRGAAPIQRAILAGDPDTGITIMQMDAGLDTGAILLQERVPISPEMSAGALHDVLAGLGARLIVSALDGLAAGTLRPVPQPAIGVTYAAKIEKTETRLEWRGRAERLARMVRAFSPQPGAWCEIAHERVRVLAAELVAREPGYVVPGTVLDDRLTVACGEGALRLLRLQRAGGTAMTAEVFLRGRRAPPGMLLA